MKTLLVSWLGGSAYLCNLGIHRDARIIRRYSETRVVVVSLLGSTREVEKLVVLGRVWFAVEEMAR